MPDLGDLARSFEVSRHTAGRVAYRHGERSRQVLSAEPEPRGTTAVCRCEPVVESELRWAIREEGARTLDDLRRRTRLSCGTCQGYRCIARAGTILAEELNLDNFQLLAQLLDLLQQRYRGKAPSLSGLALAQEELNQARYFLVGDLARQGVERPEYR